MQAKVTSKRSFSLQIITQIKHNTFIYTVLEEQIEIVCSKQPSENRTSDMCEIIIKHELCIECKVKKMILAIHYHLTTQLSFIFFFSDVAIRWRENLCSSFSPEVLS